MTIDSLDARIVEMFAAEPRVGVLECSRRLAVARGTVQARLDRLTRDGVIRGWGPELDPAAMGYVVTAFVTLEIRQHQQAHLAGRAWLVGVVDGAGRVLDPVVGRVHDEPAEPVAGIGRETEADAEAERADRRPAADARRGLT